MRSAALWSRYFSIFPCSLVFPPVTSVTTLFLSTWSSSTVSSGYTITGLWVYTWKSHTVILHHCWRNVLVGPWDFKWLLHLIASHTQIFPGEVDPVLCCFCFGTCSYAVTISGDWFQSRLLQSLVGSSHMGHFLLLAVVDGLQGHVCPCCLWLLFYSGTLLFCFVLCLDC